MQGNQLLIKKDKFQFHKVQLTQIGEDFQGEMSNVSIP